MWTEAQANLLKNMLAMGRSMRECAEVIGSGITRNACIGKAHRLGLVSTSAHAKPVGERKPKKRSEPKPRTIAKTASHILNDDLPLLSRAARFRAFAPVTVRKTIFELGHADCREIDAAGTYCGAVVEKGRSYCPYHCRLMYQPPKVRDRVDARIAA